MNGAQPPYITVTLDPFLPADLRKNIKGQRQYYYYCFFLGGRLVPELVTFVFQLLLVIIAFVI